MNEAKTSSALRILLSFCLCAFVVLLSVSSVAKGTALNPQKIEEQFTSYTFVSGVKKSVNQFANDIYLKNGLTDGREKEFFSYEEIDKTVSAYVGSRLNPNSGYAENTYKKNIEDLCAGFEKEIVNSLEKEKISYKNEDVKRITDATEEYFVSRIDMPYMDFLQTAVNIGGAASTIVTAIGLIFAVSIFFVTIFIGKKRYRSVKAVSAGFLSAGIIDLTACLIVYIISNLKIIDIYPMYLREIFMRHFYNSAGSLALAGGFIIAGALVILSAAWKLKRKDK